MDASLPSNKWVPKMSERARANREEQREGSQKRRNDGSRVDAPKKARLDPQPSTDNESEPELSPRMTQSRQSSVEEIPDEDDVVSRRGSSNGRTRAMTQNANVGPESTKDQLSALNVMCRYY